MLRDHDQSEQAITRHKGALWLLDRVSIGARFWDKKKNRSGAEHDHPHEMNLSVDSTEGSAVADLPVNEGV